MKEEKHYFRIGLFMLIGIGIFVIAVIVFGSGRFFEEEVMMETYFNGSVQGLDVGSPVKYRGVTIGEVKEIGTANQWYPLVRQDDDVFYTYGMYVMIKISLSAEAFPYIEDGAVTMDLDKLINEKGLRVKFAYLGITGLAYLELDFVDPKKNVPLEIVWEPLTIYIPSVPNTIQLVSDSINSIAQALTDDFISLLENLSEASGSFPEVSHNLSDAISHLKSILEQLKIATERVPHLSSQVTDTLTNINVISNDIRKIVALAEGNPSQVIFGKAPPKMGIERK